MSQSTYKKYLFAFFLTVFSLGFVAELPAQRQVRQRPYNNRQQGTPQPSQQPVAAIPAQPSSVSQTPLTASTALSYALDPRSKGTKNAKGNHLIRRVSLLDSIPQSKNLQIAFVIDGTDSMGLELDGVKSSVSQIVERIHELQPDGHQISLALVVYRDTGAASQGGEILLPSTEFTADCEAFTKILDGIQTVSGRPYFPESVDLGLFRAMSELKWAEGDETERWIVLIGDAPPYPEGFNMRAYRARRSYTTQSLIDLANSKDIKISCIICSSGFIANQTSLQKQLQATYKQHFSQTNEFFNALYKGTSGCTFINLADELTQQTLLSSIDVPEPTKIAPITPEDVRKKTEEIAKLFDQEQVRIAVSPFSFIDQGNTNAVRTDQLPEDEFIAIAVPVRESLKQFPNLIVSDFYQVQSRLASFSPANLNTKELYDGMEVDWILEGDVQKRGGLEKIRLSLFHRDDPEKPAATYSFSGSVKPDTVEMLFRNLMGELKNKKPDANLLKVYESVAAEQDIWSPFSDNVIVCRRISQAVYSLDCAIGLFKEDAEYNDNVKQSLQKAETYLKAALELESNNPYAHSLLANCYYNQIEEDVEDVIDDAVQANVLQEKNAETMKKVLESAQKAFDNREKCVHSLTKLEIEADNALFNKDFDTAIAKYTELVKSLTESKNRNFVIRAYWALAGIYAGDWGATDKVNPELARENIIAVLAMEKDSQQGIYFTRMLEWDNEKGSRHPYVWKNNLAFVSPKKSEVN